MLKRIVEALDALPASTAVSILRALARAARAEYDRADDCIARGWVPLGDFMLQALILAIETMTGAPAEEDAA
jgi:hypothetical protein